MSHDEALMALDYAHVAAQQICQEIEEAARAEPHDLAAYLRTLRKLVREIEQSVTQAQPAADSALSRALRGL